jgi:hypothetical protein
MTDPPSATRRTASGGLDETYQAVPEQGVVLGQHDAGSHTYRVGRVPAGSLLDAIADQHEQAPGDTNRP